MSAKLETLSTLLQERLADQLKSLAVVRGELTIEVGAADYIPVMQLLRDDPAFGFEELIDLCGVDYSAYKDGQWDGRRFAAVSHLLSVSNNWRIRVRVFAEDDEFPVISSVIDIWNSVNWFEREAFDLYGIVFTGHSDLRRILTDYGFIGHPFRKDFPVTGYVEMRYDAEQGRVVYQPLTIEMREVTPRIVREDAYGDVGHG